MKRALKVSIVHSEVRFKKKQGLTTAFTGNTHHHRKQSRKGAEDFIVDKITCHHHATLPKLNSPTTFRRNFNNSCRNFNNKSPKLKYVRKYLSTETRTI